jgi:hypothetical protein
LQDKDQVTTAYLKVYSVVGFDLHLERKINSQILNTFLPSLMFVFIGWVGFLMPVVSGERAGLLVTILLVQISVFISVAGNIPSGNDDFSPKKTSTY